MWVVVNRAIEGPEGGCSNGAQACIAWKAGSNVGAIPSNWWRKRGNCSEGTSPSSPAEAGAEVDKRRSDEKQERSGLTTTVGLGIAESDSRPTNAAV